MLAPQLWLTLHDPMDCSQSVSLVHGILQARILEWVAISYSRECSSSRDLTCVSCISSIGLQILFRCATMRLRNLQGSNTNTCSSSSSFFFFFSLWMFINMSFQKQASILVWGMKVGGEGKVGRKNSVLLVIKLQIHHTVNFIVPQRHVVL